MPKILYQQDRKGLLYESRRQSHIAPYSTTHRSRQALNRHPPHLPAAPTTPPCHAGPSALGYPTPPRSESPGIPVVHFAEDADADASTRTHIRTSAARVKRPPNAFVLYRQEYARLLKSAARSGLSNRGVDGSEISKRAAEQWRAFSNEEKRPYQEAAMKIKQQHSRDHPDYRYAPSRKVGLSTLSRKSRAACSFKATRAHVVVHEAEQVRTPTPQLVLARDDETQLPTPANSELQFPLGNDQQLWSMPPVCQYPSPLCIPFPDPIGAAGKWLVDPSMLAPPQTWPGCLFGAVHEQQDLPQLAAPPSPLVMDLKLVDPLTFTKPTSEVHAPQPYVPIEEDYLDNWINPAAYES